MTTDIKTKLLRAELTVDIDSEQSIEIEVTETCKTVTSFPSELWVFKHV